MPKFGGSFPTRHFKGAGNILLPKCPAFLSYRSFPCYFVADNQLHSPRARYVLECMHRMAEDQDRFMDHFMDGTVGIVGVAGSSCSQIVNMSVQIHLCFPNKSLLAHFLLHFREALGVPNY
eukprot:362402-Chlamydomonas_euryale.AAC.2